eukprot:PhM_4_TR18601/c0_g5_i1/m.30894
MPWHEVLCGGFIRLAANHAPSSFEGWDRPIGLKKNEWELISQEIRSAVSACWSKTNNTQNPIMPVRTDASSKALGWVFESPVCEEWATSTEAGENIFRRELLAMCRGAHAAVSGGYTPLLLGDTMSAIDDKVREAQTRRRPRPCAAPLAHSTTRYGQSRSSWRRSPTPTWKWPT